jgi:hypothetical protein
MKKGTSQAVAKTFLSLLVRAHPAAAIVLHRLKNRGGVHPLFIGESIRRGKYYRRKGSMAFGEMGWGLGSFGGRGKFSSDCDPHWERE